MTLQKIPLKVLFMSHSAEMVGAERSLVLLLKKIDRNRFVPVVILPLQGPLRDELHRLNIKTYIVKSPWWLYERRNMLWSLLHLGYNLIREPFALFDLYRIIRKEKIDIIYTNTMVNFSGALIGVLTGITHVWHIREIIPGNPDLHSFLPEKILFRLVLGLSRFIITNSHATALQFQDAGPNEKTRVIYNAVDLAEFDDFSSFPDIDNAKKTDWLVAVAGSLQKRKAQEDAIRAVSIAAEKIPNIKLLLIGKKNEDYVHYLKNIIAELDIDDRVVFTGYRRDVPRVLSHCRVVLVPSYNEPFGRTVIEAMAAGIPVIGADSGGVKEILQDGITGYLVPPKDPEKLAEKIIHLSRHPEVAEKMTDNAKKTVGERFSPEVYVQNVERVLLEASDSVN